MPYLYPALVRKYYPDYLFPFVKNELFGFEKTNYEQKS